MSVTLVCGNQLQQTEVNVLLMNAWWGSMYVFFAPVILLVPTTRVHSIAYIYWLQEASKFIARRISAAGLVKFQQHLAERKTKAWAE